MALSSLLVLSLAACGRAWPQLPAVDDDFGGAVTLPVIPYTTQGRPHPRDLPPDDSLFENLVTLPVLSPPRRRPTRRASSGNDITADILESRQVPRRSSGFLDSRPLPPNDDDIGAFVTLPIIHSTKRGVFSRAVEVQLANRSDVAYYAQLNLGTPPQAVYAQLDTGSFELWVNPSCDVLASASDRRFCQAVGFYDTAKSSTATMLEGTRTLRYGIGAANITYVKDSVSFGAGSSTMTQVQFGVATSSEDQFAGILGLGFGEGITTRYKNIVDELQSQGVTRTKAYSLGLGSKQEEEGVLVLGGVDTAKFGGPLARLPFVPAAQSPDGVPRFWVNMTSLSLTPPSGRKRMYTNKTMAVFLDSGATLTLLPAVIADAIAADFGSSSGVDANGFYPVQCYLANLPGSVDFEFAGITIKVPYKEMIREIRTTPPTCFLGIVPNSDFVLLGDTFLRSTYVVFDLDTNATYMAAYNNCGTRPVTINRPQDIAALTGLCSVTQGSIAAPSPNGGDTGAAGGLGATNGGDSRSGSPGRRESLSLLYHGIGAMCIVLYALL